MNSTLVGVLVGVAAIVIVGLLLRRAGGGGVTPVGERGPEEGRAPGRDDELGDQLDDFVDEDVEAVAVTSDGYSFLPDLHAVRVMPPGEDDDEPWSGKRSDAQGGGHRRGGQAIALSMHPGDLRGARVTRGGADDSPWLLETLGRDGEFLPWGFETREAAEAAKAVLESRGIVALGRDEEDRPVPPSREAWEEARRLWEETQAELSMDDDADPIR